VSVANPASNRGCQGDFLQPGVDKNSNLCASVTAANNPFDSNSVVTALANVQELMGRPGVVSEFQVQVDAAIHQGRSVFALARKIKAVTYRWHVGNLDIRTAIALTRKCRFMVQVE
jgi:hypothetical protein